MNQNPARSRRRSRIAHFKTPFVISVAAPAVFSVGCGGKLDPISERAALAHEAAVPGTACDPRLPPPESDGYCPPASCIDGLWEQPTCNPPPVDDCLEPPPPSPDDSCPSTARCDDGEWVFDFVACNPPPSLDQCPEEPPAAGDSCGTYVGGLVCEYEFCGGPVPMFSCSSETRTWEAIPLLSCNPPPPECFFDNSCGQESTDAGALPPPPGADAGAPDAGG